ncbi:MAG: alkaline phosphatase family protein [Ignavibacteriae bacterium]|nr:alkaline phosphatase family protein [Ignavibacteriota bacterium]
MKTFLVFCLLLFVNCQAIQTQAERKPKLIVLISVDQMRADYLDKFAHQFTGGFRRLLDEGVIYTNADLGYAASETGPGHATLATGAFPRTHGIVENDWVDPVTKNDIYCVEDSTALPVEGEGGGYSPRNLAVTAFGDWLKSASPASKVVSVSAKDRSAILMGGQHPTLAFWYHDRSGRMVTSDYYLKQLPAWAKRFNDSGWIQKNVPEAWTKSLPEEAFAGDTPDSYDAEALWDSSTTFPHKFSLKRITQQIKASPYVDKLVSDFALIALKEEQLGSRGVTDFLAVSYSCTDYVGHDYGPNSHEIREHIIQLDKTIGEFLAALERQVGKENMIVALSADHGVLPLPEYLTEFKHLPARRIDTRQTVVPQARELDRKMQREFNISENLIDPSGFLNYRAAAAQGVDSMRLEQRFRAGALSIDGVEDVYFQRELRNANTPHRLYLEKYVRGYYPPRSRDFFVRFCELCLVGTRVRGTTHGTPYPHDTHVPVVFWGMKLEPERIDRAILAVDIAPTLAQAAGIEYPKTVEGQTLEEVLKQQ